MALDKLVVRGAREHNLKNVYLEIPRDKMVVITGLSGSGKKACTFSHPEPPLAVFGVIGYRPPHSAGELLRRLANPRGSRSVAPGLACE